MIIPSTRLFTAGEVETGAYLNSAVTNLGNFMLGKPIAYLRQTAAQTLTTATNTLLTFDTEDIDRDNGHSTTTNTSRYTAQTAGWYFITGAASFVGNATGTRVARFLINGTALNAGGNITSATLNTNTCVAPISNFVYLNVGDYLEIQVQQSSGANLNTYVTAPYQSFMSVIWVSS
jgi:hypothetical protein